MVLYFTNVLVKQNIIDRKMFFNYEEAKAYAKAQLQEKVWNLGEGKVYFGDVLVELYEMKDLFSSTDIDKNIL